MAGYMVLFWDDEAAWAAANEQDVEQAMQAHRDFGARYAHALRGGSRLYPSGTATSVRHARAGIIVTDGAFAETKEHIGGYYLLEAADLDEALAIAKAVPCPYGWVELRPVLPGSEYRPA
jgi:hypothetical protein